MSCPNCGTELPDPRGPYRPFCSERCKLLDLGRWLDGSYRVEGEAASASEISEELERQRVRSDED